ncbi:MAG: hypothetical protein GY788_12195 [bacterium]|nr:hypothetical protein [bacterium]MCP4305616.1 hypothetical protein [bacterium]
MMPRILAATLFAALLAAGASNVFSSEIQEEREGGIVATGIVGTITELGSIYMNGQHVRFDEGLSVASPLGERPASSLVPGETVVVEALRRGDDWQADVLRAYLPLVGPISRLGERSLTMLGATVVIPEDALSMTAFVGSDLVDGDWVAVSGLWNGDAVVSSRIEKVQPLPLASAVGTYYPDVPTDRVGGADRVGAVLMHGVEIEHARPLDVLTVQGAPTDNGIDVETVAIGLFTGPVGEVLFEGYLSQPGIGGAYTVQGSGFLAYVGDPQMVIDPNRGLFCGRAEGVTTIERVLDLPDAVSPRDDILNDFRTGMPPACID